MAQEFVVFCEARTGSYSLVSRLSSCADIICHPEIFKKNIIELHEWHLTRLSINTVEDRNRNAMAFIGELRKMNPFKIFGFKLFNHHLKWAPGAMDYLTAETTRRLILIRDPVEVYASAQRAAQNGVWTLSQNTDVPIETLRMKIRFTPESLAAFAQHYNGFLRQCSRLAAMPGSFVIDHRQLDDATVGDALLSCLGSAGRWSDTSSEYRRQFEAPVQEGFENWDDLVDYIARHRPFVALPPRTHRGAA